MSGLFLVIVTYIEHHEAVSIIYQELAQFARRSMQLQLTSGFIAWVWLRLFCVVVTVVVSVGPHDIGCVVIVVVLEEVLWVNRPFLGVLPWWITTIGKVGAVTRIGIESIAIETIRPSAHTNIIISDFWTHWRL